VNYKKSHHELRSKMQNRNGPVDFLGCELDRFGNLDSVGDIQSTD